MNYSITFVLEGRTVSMPEGSTLLEAQIAANLPTDAPCGGKGACKKCEVAFRAAGEAEWRRALACRTKVTGNMEVRLLRGGEKLRVMTDGMAGEAASWNPLARVSKLTVPPCPRGESRSDWTRLCEALSASTGVTEWTFNAAVCRDLGRLLSENGGELWAVTAGNAVLELSAEQPRAYMAAFDLGTTSIAGYLIDVNAARQTASVGMRNPQAQYGGDVISRADYALAHGPEALADCARQAIDTLIRRMCMETGVSWERVCAVLLAGNTAMHHLFLGISPDSLVRAPYNPVVSQPLALDAADCGLAVHPSAKLFMLPVIGGFVGADTVACLISGDWLNRDKLTLMIDIGTNGELVMGNRHRRLACSTAAGPAFEGAKIACGMRGAEGAIDHVWLEDGVLRWHVIGDGPARGLCGSGLVDLTAALLAAGAMDETGRLRDGDRYNIGDTGVYLTQKDVREVQLAKGAMAAGIQLMAQRLGIGLEDIEEVDIAGAFGNYIDPDNACAIGLIPAILRDRIVPVGNAAGDGARLAMMDASAWASAQTLAQGTTFLELATMPEFQDEFVDQLSFGEEDE